MSHIKRKAIEKSWPLPRKGTKYLIRPYPGKKSEFSIPLGIALREILKIAATKREVKELLNNNEIIVDGKIRKEIKFPLNIFDVLSIPKIKKDFRIILNEKGKLSFDEIKEKDIHLKTCKVIGKKTIKNGIQQINCFDGRNLICKDKINVNDSIVYNLKENKIAKVLPLKTGAEVFITGGAHIGERGKITEINKNIKIQIKNKNFEVHAKNIYAI